MKSERIFDIKNDKCIDYVEKFTNIREFVKDFRKEFDCILAYHATNLNEKEVNKIKIDGLVVSNRELLKQKAIDRFIKVDDSLDLQNEIRTKIESYIDTEGYICVDQIFFGLIKGSFLTDFYQYLLLGPETLVKLATQLKQKHSIPFRKRMIEFGLHYIIHARVPVKKIKTKYIEDIYKYLNKGSLELALEYNYNLPAEFLIFEKMERPVDFHNFEFM